MRYAAIALFLLGAGCSAPVPRETPQLLIQVIEAATTASFTSSASCASAAKPGTICHALGVRVENQLGSELPDQPTWYSNTTQGNEVQGFGTGPLKLATGQVTDYSVLFFVTDGGNLTSLRYVTGSFVVGRIEGWAPVPYYGNRMMDWLDRGPELQGWLARASGTGHNFIATLDGICGRGDACRFAASVAIKLSDARDDAHVLGDWETHVVANDFELANAPFYRFGARVDALQAGHEYEVDLRARIPDHAEFQEHASFHAT